MTIQPPKGLPTTGWWLDTEIVPCYHGTFSHKFHSIQDQGLVPGSSGLCYVSPSYLTAATFSVWGEEGIDTHIERAFNGKLQIYRPSTYAVIHFALPRDFIEKNALYRDGTEKSFFSRHKQPRLADRRLYDAFSGTDEEYYDFEEVKFQCVVPPEFISGISFPYC